MNRNLLVRGAAALFTVAALAPVTVAAVGVGTASASGTSQITCAKMKGNETAQSLSKCTGPLDIVGGTKPGKGTASSAATTPPSGPYTEGQLVTWGAGGAGGTSTVGITYVEGTGCPGTDLTIVESGTIVSGTGNAVALNGDSATSTVCLSTKKGTLANLKGTTLSF